MEKAFLIFVIFFCSASLYSAEPLVKFYLDNGTSKQYNLSEIDNMKFTSATETLQFHIFKNNGKSLYYPAQLIDSIKFAVDYANENRLHLWHDGFVWNVAIHEIDSILFYYTEFVAVTIGEQHWMYRNLNVDHYRNGDSIPEVRESTRWSISKTGSWCYYNNDQLLGAIYGKLYNWYTVSDPRGLAPSGWHIPANNEFYILSTVQVGSTSADSKLRSTGTKESKDGLWRYKSNSRATNESGFSGLPGGYRITDGSCYYICENGYWWSNSESILSVHFWYLSYDTPSFYSSIVVKETGFNIRCIKDK